MLPVILNYTVEPSSTYLYVVKQKVDKTYELDSTDETIPGKWKHLANLNSMQLTDQQNNLAISMSSSGNLIYIVDRFNLLLHIFNSNTLTLDADKRLPMEARKQAGDFSQNQTFYVAPNGDLYIAGGKQLFISTNNGTSWQILHTFNTNIIKIMSNGEIMLISTQDETENFYVASLTTNKFRKQPLRDLGYVSNKDNFLNAVLLDSTTKTALLTFYNSNIALKLSYNIASDNSVYFKEISMDITDIIARNPTGLNLTSLNIFDKKPTITSVIDINNNGSTKTLTDQLTTPNKYQIIARGRIPTISLENSDIYQSLPKLQTITPSNSIYLDQAGQLYLGSDNSATWTKIPLDNQQN